MTTSTNPANIRQQLAALKQQEPRLRARNAAAKLGISEGELLAARCDGEQVIRLREDYQDILESLVKLGQVLTITRNDYAVHEKRGYYDNLQLKSHGGGAFDHNINLRIFFNNWAYGFAVHDESHYGARLSLQFFDVDGTSVHKIYRTEDSDPVAWDALVERFRADNQVMNFVPEKPKEPYTPEPPTNVDAKALCAQWREKTDIHEFWFMLREHKLRRIDALKLATPDLARQVAPDAWRDVLQKACYTGLPIMIFTRSPGVAQIHTGPIYKLVEKNGWFNVLDPTFNLHLRTEEVSEVWVVYKPSETGGQTSLELYHKNGQLISHIYGAVNLSAPELRRWRDLLAEVPSLEPATAEA